MNKENLFDMDLQYFAEDPEPEDKKGDEETLTKDEVNRLIAQQKSKAKEEAEKEYQAKMDELKNEYESQLEEATSKLGEKDKEDFDLAKAQRELDELRAQLDKEQQEKESLSTQIQRANMQERAIEELTEKKLPVNETVLKFVVKDNADDTLQAIEDLSNLLTEEKKKYAQDEPPNTSGGFSSKDNEGTENDLFNKAKITGF